MRYLWGKVDDLQPLPFRVVHRIGRPAVLLVRWQTQWSFIAKSESPTQVFGVSMETLFKIAETLEVPASKLFEE